MKKSQFLKCTQSSEDKEKSSSLLAGGAMSEDTAVFPFPLSYWHLCCMRVMWCVRCTQQMMLRVNIWVVTNRFKAHLTAITKYSSRVQKNMTSDNTAVSHIIFKWCQFQMAALKQRRLILLKGCNLASSLLMSLLTSLAFISGGTRIEGRSRGEELSGSYNQGQTRSGQWLIYQSGSDLTLSDLDYSSDKVRSMIDIPIRQWLAVCVTFSEGLSLFLHIKTANYLIIFTWERVF